MERIFILERRETVGNDSFKDIIAISHESGKLTKMVKIILESDMTSKNKWERKGNHRWMVIHPSLEYRITEHFVL